MAKNDFPSSRPPAEQGPVRRALQAGDPLSSWEPTPFKGLGSRAPYWVQPGAGACRRGCRRSAGRCSWRTESRPEDGVDPPGQCRLDDDRERDSSVHWDKGASGVTGSVAPQRRTVTSRGLPRGSRGKALLCLCDLGRVPESELKSSMLAEPSMSETGTRQVLNKLQH